MKVLPGYVLTVIAAMILLTKSVCGQITQTGVVRDTSLLKAAVVTGSKPLIEREVDRIVFNVENSIAARGTDLLHGLELTPLIVVDNKGISIVGKSGVAVMINGRLLPLRGNDLVNYLSSLRSDDVSKIEVITTPPARYEAQGNSGLINIVLKKNSNIGWSGNVSSTYAQATYPGVTNSGGLNYRSAALSGSLKLRQFHRMQAISEEIDILDQDPILSSDSRKPTTDGVGANLSMEYKIDKRSDVGFIYDVGKSITDIDETDRSTYLTGNSTDSVLTTLTTRNNPTLTQLLNAYYDLKLDSTGKVMSWGFNGFKYYAELHSGTFGQLPMKGLGSGYHKEHQQLCRIIMVAANGPGPCPFRWAAVETGGKFTNFNDHSQVGYYNFAEKTYTMDSSKSNSFRYDEKNIAGYLSAQKDLSSKWAAKAGLRYEYAV